MRFNCYEKLIKEEKKIRKTCRKLTKHQDSLFTFILIVFLGLAGLFTLQKVWAADAPRFVHPLTLSQKIAIGKANIARLDQMIVEKEQDLMMLSQLMPRDAESEDSFYEDNIEDAEATLKKLKTRRAQIVKAITPFLAYATVKDRIPTSIAPQTH